MKKLLIASSLIAMFGQAYAGNGHDQGRRCRSADMDGDWVAYQAEVLKNPHTGVCDFTVRRGEAKGVCDFTLPNASGLAFVGTAVVNPDCSVDLTMDFAPAPFVSKFQLQLAKNGETYAGRWENTFGAIGPTNGVKK